MSIRIAWEWPNCGNSCKGYKKKFLKLTRCAGSSKFPRAVCKQKPIGIYINSYAE